MDEQMRSAWSRPELIVIVRGNAEEAVLTDCRGGTSAGAISVVSNCTDDGCSAACSVICES